MAWGGIYWLVLIYTIMDFVCTKGGDFLDKLMAVDFTRRIPLFRVSYSLCFIYVFNERGSPKLEV